MFTQLAEGVNVLHKEEEDRFGRGRIVGISERVKYDQEEKKEHRKYYCLVIWENERDVVPSFHEPTELTNIHDFDEFYNEDDDDDGDGEGDGEGEE